jgi:hypothetical protein
LDNEAAPRITVLGIYMLTDDRSEYEELLRREVESSEEFAFQWTEGGLEGYAAEIWDLRSNAALIEALVENPDDQFDAGGFMQADPSLPRDSWQVAWQESYLSADGETCISGGYSPRRPNDCSFRVAFFIHYWKPGLPLLSSYGPLAYPDAAPQPERLRRLVPYSPPD